MVRAALLHPDTAATAPAAPSPASTDRRESRCASPTPRSPSSLAVTARQRRALPPAPPGSRAGARPSHRDPGVRARLSSRGKHRRPGRAGAELDPLHPRAPRGGRAPRRHRLRRVHPHRVRAQAHRRHVGQAGARAGLRGRAQRHPPGARGCEGHRHRRLGRPARPRPGRGRGGRREGRAAPRRPPRAGVAARRRHRHGAQRLRPRRASPTSPGCCARCTGCCARRRRSCCRSPTPPSRWSPRARPTRCASGGPGSTTARAPGPRRAPAAPTTPAPSPRCSPRSTRNNYRVDTIAEPEASHDRGPASSFADVMRWIPPTVIIRGRKQGN